MQVHFLFDEPIPDVYFCNMALYQLTSLLLFASLLYVSRADEKQSTNHHFFKVQPGGEMHIVSRNLVRLPTSTFLITTLVPFARDNIGY